MDIIWPLYQLIFCLSHDVSCLRADTGLAPVGAVTSLSDPNKHPAQVGCSSEESQLLPISDRPEDEDPITIMVSLKWRVWTSWLSSAKILWLIIITCEHQLQKDLVEELLKLLKKPHLNWVAFCLFMPVAGVREKVPKSIYFPRLNKGFPIESIPLGNSKTGRLWIEFWLS